MKLTSRLVQFRLAAALATVLAAAACDGRPTPTTPAPMPQPTNENPAPAPTPTPDPVPAAPPSSRYLVTFDATWSRSTHPQDPPDAPHFSPLIGGTHRASVVFWDVGRLATPGIQWMAEAGSRSPLDAEVRAAIAAGDGEFVVTRDGQINSPARVTFELTISQTYPLITLVTMVAPSPDWFVGVSGLPLFENGAWREDVRVDLFPYDAGTDNGVSFMSPDDESRPHGPISRLTGFPFLVNGAVAPLGTLTFRRLQ
jgi:hypothetical protein